MEGLEERGIIFEGKTHGGVVQDKITPRRLRVASGEPWNAGGVAFARHEHKFATNPAGDRTTEVNAVAFERVPRETPQASQRPKHHGSQKRQLIPVTGCVPSHIAAQLEKMRDQKGKRKLSRSEVIADILKKGVQRHVDMQYGATLEPVIERTIARRIDQATARTATLALEAFFSAEQARILNIYTLRLLLGSDIDILPQMIQESEEQARLNMKRSAYTREPEEEYEQQYKEAAN
jgi:hypothetical protein